MPATSNKQKCINCDWTGFDHQVCPKCDSGLVEA